jgi:hypothetical protein
MLVKASGLSLLAFNGDERRWIERCICLVVNQVSRSSAKLIFWRFLLGAYGRSAHLRVLQHQNSVSSSRTRSICLLLVLW